MSCFSCCGEDEFHKVAESGGPYIVKNPAGNLIHKLEGCIKDDDIYSLQFRRIHVFLCNISIWTHNISFGCCLQYFTLLICLIILLDVSSLKLY